MSKTPIATEEMVLTLAAYGLFLVTWSIFETTLEAAISKRGGRCCSSNRLDNKLLLQLFDLATAIHDDPYFFSVFDRSERLNFSSPVFPNLRVPAASSLVRSSSRVRALAGDKILARIA
jgi:hypothetical protein